MKDNRRRRQHRSPAIAALARARPARLDADAARRDSWPEPVQIFAAAGLTDDDPVGSPSDHGHRGGRSNPLVHAKLLGAMTSAAVTAVVIVVAVFVGAVLLRAPHRQPAAAPSTSVSSRSSPGKPSGSRLVFRALTLGPHWHGHLAYAVNYGMVYLAGIATPDRLGSQSGNEGPVATLPPAARPAGQPELVVAVSAGAAAIKIAAGGQIDLVEPPNAIATWVSLAGVSFPVGSR